MFYAILWLFCVPFESAMRPLSSSIYAERAAATRVLRETYPWCAPACLAVLVKTDSVEVRSRVERVIEPLGLDAIADAARWDAVFRRLVNDPEEIDGLPWLSGHKYLPISHSEPLRDAFARYVSRLREERGLYSGYQFPCETHQEADFWCQGWMTGIQNLRFAVRGLPDPQCSGYPLWAIRMAWSMKKAFGKRANK